MFKKTMQSKLVGTPGNFKMSQIKNYKANSNKDIRGNNLW